jgi:hypothetical protein
MDVEGTYLMRLLVSTSCITVVYNNSEAAPDIGSMIPYLKNIQQSFTHIPARTCVLGGCLCVSYFPHNSRITKSYRMISSRIGEMRGNGFLEMFFGYRSPTIFYRSPSKNMFFTG